MSFEPEIVIRGATARVTRGTDTLVEVPVEALVQELGRAAPRPGVGVLPRGIRAWEDRGEVLGVALEIEPHTRTARWLTEDSPAPYGPRAKYREVFLAFPWVVLLAVFVRGGLSRYHQVFYRTASLDRGQDLLLTNLPNVAAAYDQKSWICFQHVRGDLAALPWPQKLRTLLDHVFSAGFNRSAEEHEGHSFWQSSHEIDPRVASLEAWERATAADRWFPLDVDWRSAGTTASRELERMLVAASRRRRLRNGRELAGLITRAAGQEAQR